MAAYNGEQFIAEQLRSIIEQSLMPNEIVICDDSRDERTFNAIQPFIAKYPELIKYHHNAELLKVSKNFEKAIALTTGDIIFLSDQDDVWRSDKIEQLVALMNTATNCGGAFCNSELVDKDLKSLGNTHWDLRGFHGADIHLCPDSGMMDFCLKRIPAAGHNMAFRSELKDLLLPFPDLVECHDTWIGLIIEGSNRWSFTTETLTQFRQHETNLSQAGRNSQLKIALESIKNDTFSWSMHLYDEVIKRLSGSSYSIKPQVLELLKDRREHSATRAKMNCNIFKRLPLICGEINNQRYFKYGRGWKNVIQDLILRGF